jgi:hypothetical protein
VVPPDVGFCVGDAPDVRPRPGLGDGVVFAVIAWLFITSLTCSSCGKTNCEIGRDQLGPNEEALQVYGRWRRKLLSFTINGKYERCAVLEKRLATDIALAEGTVNGDVSIGFALRLASTQGRIRNSL